MFIMRLFPMNIHHLELFHYVARHGGISKALPHIPYGIQQPAVSAQLIRLEKELGGSLFRRRPFALTSGGTKLFAFSRPFFERIDDLEQSLRHGTKHLRIAAAETVLRDHLPNPLKTLKAERPDLHVSLRGIDGNSLDMLANGDLDLVIGPDTGPTPPGILIEHLIEARLLLMAPEGAGKGPTAAFLKRNAGRLPLITLPAAAWITRMFSDELGRRGISWQPSMELGGLDLIQRYVEEGFGVGLTVEGTAPDLAGGFRAIPLDRFPKLRMAAFHAGKPDPVTRRLLDMIPSGVKRYRARTAR